MQSNRIDCTKQRTMFAFICMLWLVVGQLACTSAITMDKAAYKDVVIEIKDYVPVERCQDILLDIEVSLNISSKYLIFLNQSISVC